MKTFFSILTVLVLSIILFFSFQTENIKAHKTNCDVNIYIANNTLFEINVYIDGVGMGNLLIGKNKTYTTTLIDDKPKRLKVKVTYQNPDNLEPSSINYMTKKIECGQSDSVYIAFTK